LFERFLEVRRIARELETDMIQSEFYYRVVLGIERLKQIGHAEQGIDFQTQLEEINEGKTVNEFLFSMMRLIQLEQKISTYAYENQLPDVAMIVNRPRPRTMQ